MIYTQLFLTFFKIGLFSFGGGYACLLYTSPGQKALQVFTKYCQTSVFVVRRPTADVRSDDHIGKTPQGAVHRQRLFGKNI